jgi:chromosome segregation ATPase
MGGSEAELIERAHQRAEMQGQLERLESLIAERRSALERLPSADPASDLLRERQALLASIEMGETGTEGLADLDARLSSAQARRAESDAERERLADLIEGLLTRAETLRASLQAQTEADRRAAGWFLRGELARALERYQREAEQLQRAWGEVVGIEGAVQMFTLSPGAPLEPLQLPTMTEFRDNPNWRQAQRMAVADRLVGILPG